MRADKPGGTVDVQQYATAEAEAQTVGEDVADLVIGQRMPAASIAVLSRTAGHADDIVRAIQDHGVPVTDWRSARQLPPERRMLMTCMSVVRARLTTGQATKLSELLCVELIEERDTHAFLETHAGNPVADGLLALRTQAFDEPQPSIVAACAQRAIAAHDPTLAAPTQALVDAVEDFERFDPNFSLEHLLVELALKAGGHAPTEGGGVKIATLHGTKGLQWPIVYLVGLDEHRLPYYRSVQEGTIDEERRACFVGVCRAEDRLVLTYARSVRNYPQEPSRFLREMDLL
jgi:superfamily I DNA/RNA helicase